MPPSERVGVTSPLVANTQSVAFITAEGYDRISSNRQQYLFSVSLIPLPDSWLK